MENVMHILVILRLFSTALGTDMSGHSWWIAVPRYVLILFNNFAIVFH